MKTKIVYALSSSWNDFYLEQLWMSVYSVRLYHPEVQIEVVVDKETAESLVGKCANWQKMINQLHVIDCPKEYDTLYKSRYLKTTLREYIVGDYLFIDTDTVICAPLTDVDEFEGDICGVLDNIQPTLYGNTPSGQRAIQLGWSRIVGQPYINTGILYVKDNEATHNFYTLWHKYWLESVSKGLHYDQQCFGMVRMDTGDLVKEIPSKWNFQMKGMPLGTKLGDAIVLHYFASVSPTKWSSFAFETPQCYEEIRSLGDIPQWLKEMIKTPELSFGKRLVLLDAAQQELYLSSTARLYLWHPKTRRFLDGLSTMLLNLKEFLHNKRIK